MIDLKWNEVPVQTDAGTVTDTLVTMTCADGFRVTLGSFGASIRSIETPLPDGYRNVVLALAAPGAYAGNDCCAGAVLAPNAGRICGGFLPVGDVKYPLECNEGPTTSLHGGPVNASFMNWTVSPADGTGDGSSANEAGVIFETALPDGLCGFPGNRKIRAVYTLREDHTLELRLQAVSDKDTYLNLSNHAYINLNGDFTDSALDQKLQIFADSYLANDETSKPVKIVPVEGTPYDYREPATPRENREKYPDDAQAAMCRGMNNAFVLREASGQAGLRHALAAQSVDGAVSMDIYTDAPSMVVYNSGWLPDGMDLKDGLKSHQYGAIAFECQDYPDAPGGLFPYVITKAGETFERCICWVVK